ncbi:arabinan endo-1,5-alpha-L-arabinosidase [Puia sp. P3]|uniref:arabinan endo-1,5-alpha-L-arabinosidase n=1 Tax=Puia sp. P3 TaxID=3423952 RepID=UPI003D665319
MRRLLAFLTFFANVAARAQLPIHDPVMIKEKNTFYLFSTGMGISVFSSGDLQHWNRERPVFSQPPQWALDAVPGFKGHIWAPDISYHDGKYYLYYAVSAFGKNTSCIGVAVNGTLDAADPAFHWEDKGKVVQSVPGRDMWNAIDPNLIVDSAGVGWLAFGSFWDGIKLVRLAPGLEAVARPEEWHTIARRPRDFNEPDSSAGTAAVEAPFIFRHGGYYYLFVSYDYCCRAEKSTYKVVVGRSVDVRGPYLDRSGVSLVQGGGSLVLQGDGVRWYAAGHNAVYSADGKDYFVCHGYDVSAKGQSRLILAEVKWVDGWPVVDAGP